MDTYRDILERLRISLAGSGRASTFLDELGERLHQLVADMIDGRVLPKQEACALRAAIIDLVRDEALPTLASRNPSDALLVLDKLKAYGYRQLEAERPRLESARVSRFPAPAPATWPELAELSAAAERYPSVCKVGGPIQNAAFVHELEQDGILVPEEALAVYAWSDGFDLSCLAAEYLPVFSLLPSDSIDVSDEEGSYPRRAVLFQGGDEVQFSVYRDSKTQWWLVYECEYEPIGRRLLDLRELIRYGLARMRAPTTDALVNELSWNRYFRIPAP
jgi:hypothetical protein